MKTGFVTTEYKVRERTRLAGIQPASNHIGN